MTTQPDDKGWRDNPSFLQSAAWVPDDDAERPWSEAGALAAEWLWQRCEVEGRKPLLVTNSRQSHVLPEFADIVQEGGHATPRSKDTFERGPVVAYVPDAKSLAFATGLARGSSLVVVEGSQLSLREWAAGVGATNLLDRAVTTTGIPADVVKSLDSAIFFGGNNGWSGQHEKQNARKILSDHVRQGTLTPDDAAAYALSRGVNDDGAKRLKTLLEKVR